MSHATKGVCEKLDEDTNEVFCKCNKTRHHDTDSDSEDEDEDDVDVVEVPLRKRRAAGRRFGGQRNGGRHRQEGGRRQRNPVLCGTYDPTTGDISVSEPCTKGVCAKVDEETNEVFCKCNKKPGIMTQTLIVKMKMIQVKMILMLMCLKFPSVA